MKPAVRSRSERELHGPDFTRALDRIKAMPARLDVEIGQTASYAEDDKVEGRPEERRFHLALASLLRAVRAHRVGQS